MATEIEPAEPVLPRVENPFPVPVDERLAPGMVAVESERAVAEVKAALTIARACPRDKHRAMEKILDICSRTEFAKTALYRYKRGGNVEGLTIRAAEVIANAWGNMSFGLRELAQDAGMSEWLAYAWDLETNTKSDMSFQFKHERHTTDGVKQLKDPRDIYELGANYGARRLRSRILAIVDQDVVAAAERQVKTTLVAEAAGHDKKTFGEKVAEIQAQFKNKFGVTVEHINAFLGHKIESITPEEFVELGTIYVALRDGEGKPSEYFTSMPKTASASEAAQDVDAKLTGKKPADKPESEPPNGLPLE